MVRNLKVGAAGKRARAVCIACRRVECGCVSARRRLAELRAEERIVVVEEDERPIMDSREVSAFVQRLREGIA